MKTFKGIHTYQKYFLWSVKYYGCLRMSKNAKGRLLMPNDDYECLEMPGND